MRALTWRTFATMLALAGFTLACGGTALAGSQRALPTADYFPLQVGNTWVYKVTNTSWQIPDREQAFAPAARIAVVSITESVCHVDGQEVFTVDNYGFPMASAPINLFNDEQGSTGELFDGKSGTWYPWSSPDQLVELPPFAPDCLHGSRGKFVSSSTVIVPAGIFNETRTVRYDELPCQDSGWLTETFAPRVGLVERRTIEFAGEVTWSLLYAVVDGVVFGAPAVDGAASGTPVPREGVEQRTWGGIKAAFGR